LRSTSSIIRRTPIRKYLGSSAVGQNVDLLEQQPQPRFYLLYTHGGSQVIVRSAVSAKAMIPLLRDTLKQFGPRVIIYNIKPMAEIVAQYPTRVYHARAVGSGVVDARNCCGDRTATGGVEGLAGH
jgi:hypothetical protein